MVLCWAWSRPLLHQKPQSSRILLSALVLANPKSSSRPQTYIRETLYLYWDALPISALAATGPRPLRYLVCPRRFHYNIFSDNVGTWDQTSLNSPCISMPLAVKKSFKITTIVYIALNLVAIWTRCNLTKLMMIWIFKFKYHNTTLVKLN